MKRNAFILPVLALFLLLSFPPSLPAQQDVKIGVIYPMSGPIAQAGLDNRHAIELALEIINTTKHKDLNLPLAKTAGLPNLGGAKLSVIFADHQGKPDLGLSEAERLLTQEKVVALLRLLQQQRDRDRQHGRRADEDALLQPRVLLPPTHPEGFQVVLPQHAPR